MGKSKIIKLPEIIIKKFVSSALINSPSCVLKELIENSLDANSSKIIIYIEKNGYDLIKVIDNGSGICKNDMKKVSLRYNTSKINNLDDLNKIMTYGFRGEALFAIKALSNLEIMSKPANQSMAWRASFNSDENILLIPAASLNGTIVSVKNLACHNIKSLYYNYSVFDDIFLVFKILALSKLNIHFVLFKDGNKYINLPSCFDNYSKVKRIEALGLKNFPANAADLFFKSSNFCMSGFFFIDKDRRPIYNYKLFFINDRFINDPQINEIINNVAKIYLSKKEFLCYCFYLYIDPSLFVINFVSKNIEVNFNSSGIYSFIENCLIQALSDNLGRKPHHVEKNDYFSHENKKDYWLMNSSLIDESTLVNKNEILTVIDDKFLFFEMDNNIFAVLLKNLRGKILLDLCIKQFVNEGNIIKKDINIYKFLTLHNTDTILLYKKMFMKYGFDFTLADNTSILITAVPALLYDLFINWNELFNELINFFDNSVVNHLSTVRFDKQIIYIFIKHIYNKSPCYNKELNNLYLDLINIKKHDIKWFNTNCFPISCRKIKFN